MLNNKVNIQNLNQRIKKEILHEITDDKIDHNDDVTNEEFGILKQKLNDDVNSVTDSLTKSINDAKDYLTEGINDMEKVLLDQTQEMREIQQEENLARKRENEDALTKEIYFDLILFLLSF